MLISPLPPPAGGIASWTSAILPRLKSFRDLEMIHVDTAIRWRTQSDRNIVKRLIGGTYQACVDILRTRSTMIASRPDVMHLCTAGSLATLKDIRLLGMARKRGIRTVIHYRMGRLPEIIARDGWEWRVTRKAIESADTVLVLDRESGRSVKGVLPHASVAHIPNPVDLDMVTGIPGAADERAHDGKARRIITVGHLIRSKGIGELVRACLLLDTAEISLELVGPIEDDYKRELQRIGSSRAHGQWLSFHGQLDRPEAIRRMRGADLFVLPSHTEGFPNVILEAMALAKPIVATAVGAIAEMLDRDTDHPCGIVVPPRDVTALHRALQDMLAHPDRARLFGQRAQDKVRTSYAMERILNDYVHLWRAVAESSES